jgi:hypothetical protein
MKQKKRGGKARARPRRQRRGPVVEERPPVEQPPAIEEPETPAGQPGDGPRLSGGDVDADWSRAGSTGEEAVGGSVATPDQDVVDEIGQALGVEQEPEAEVATSEEILRRRDRFRWHLERDAETRERREEDRRDRDALEDEGNR